MINQIQTQNEEANIPIFVGVEDVRTEIKIKKNIHVPTISLLIGLQNKRGAHMSRFIQSLTEVIGDETKDNLNSLEEYGVRVFESLKLKHEFNYFELNIASHLAIPTITPVSNLKTIEVHDIILKLVYDVVLKKTLTVKVIGGSACPHGQVNNGKGRTHLQRSEILLSFTSDNLSDVPRFEDLIDICNASFSSPTYTLLKTPDEQFVINTMFENPKFVEDISRSVVENCKKCLSNGKVIIKITNYESIHKHNVIAMKELIL